MYKSFNNLSTMGEFETLTQELTLDLNAFDYRLDDDDHGHDDGGYIPDDAGSINEIVRSFHDGVDIHDDEAPDFSTLIGSEGYDIPTLEMAGASSNLTFTLNDTGGVGAGSQAEAGFLAAAALWISFLADDVDIRLDVGFRSLAPGVLGSAGSDRATIAYSVYRDALIADGTSADDATAIANLEMGDSLNFATQDQTGTFILDNNGSANNTFLSINRTTALALGISVDANGDAIDDGVTAYANISFNSDFTFDFDPTDGIDAGAIDFVGVAFHEIGHALGFTSGVDIVDGNSTIDLNGFAIFNQLDVFRYSDNAQAQFGAGTRDLGYGGDPFFSIDGGATNLGFFSSGRNNGDGQQASHWRDGLGLGIMDPTSAPAGQENMITELDIRAFDVIGWDRVGESAEPPINLTEGDDTFTGTPDGETINGLGGNDIIDGAGGNDFVNGDAGNDTLFGGDGNDTLNGGEGGDTLTGGQGGDLLNGGAGDDMLIGGDGGDGLNGGDGFDTVDYRGAAAGVTLDVDAGGTGGEADGDSFSSVERFYLSDFDDTAIGSDENDIIFGKDGDDIIFGEIGDDVLDGGDGNDILRGGNDLGFTGPVFGDGEITRDAGAGNDSIANALNIDDEYSLDADPNILNATTIPHVTISATGDGTVHFYGFTVYGPDSNVSLDIDFGDTGDAGSFDSFLELFDAAGNSIATNDFFPFPGGAGGSTSNNDALINFLITAPGTYFVAVSESGGGGVPSGATYELNVSAEDTSINDPDAGDDTLTGGMGDDMLEGGAGTDSAAYSGVQANYTVTDNIDGSYTVVDNVGTDGTDTLENIEFLIFSDVTIDIVTAATSGGPIDGTPGNDDLMGTVGDDIINGLDGNDVLTGLAGNDALNGGDGVDTLIGGEGADELNGGGGLDSADYRGALAGVAFNVLTGGTGGEANGDSFSSVERFFLSNFNDTVTGSDANEFFFGENGNDTINGGGGIDRIDGGAGNDIQRGQDGNDTLFGSAGADQLNGGAGTDVANYDLATSAVELSLATGGTVGDAAGDTYFGIEIVIGSDFDDIVEGNNSVNDLRGGDGNDTLIGLGGNDRFIGGEGADAFDGGSGIDIVNYTLATNSVHVDLVVGGDDIGGVTNDADGDSYNSIEWVFGSDFNDNILGDSASNRLEGRGGDDFIEGRGGNDRLLGGDGNDVITGDDGIDTIFGQAGNDTLSGGAGNDFFFGSSGGDSIDGGADFDTVSYLASSAGVIVNLAVGGSGGDAAGDTYINVERVFGTSFDDSITGSNDNDILLGNGGSDYLAGGQGNDSLIGGAGSDSFGYDTATDGADVISDFFGGETIFILGGDTNFDTFAELQTIASDAGANVIFNFGGGNTLTVVGRNIADLSAGDFDFSGTPPASEPLDDPDAFAADIVDTFDMDALI
ncbi:MAG: NF038122 family metalloprotease [Hellea sp.]